jgi:hypothetical protein
MKEFPEGPEGEVLPGRHITHRIVVASQYEPDVVGSSLGPMAYDFSHPKPGRGSLAIPVRAHTPRPA